MRDLLYLAWRYLVYYRIKTVVLVGSITLIVYLPAGLNTLVSESANELTSRAEATPLLLGAKGSPLELVLSSLYFESDTPPTLRYAEVTRLEESALASVIPLYTRFKTRDSTIVGTSLDYFAFRGLKFGEGRPFDMLGECVLGSQAAILGGVRPGDKLMSKPDGVFDIGGVYPLNMHVVGVLQQTGTPDDRAVFVDVKTAWVIEGLAHGHADISIATARPSEPRQDGRQADSHPAVAHYNEVTLENVASFHFHGDKGSFPVTAAIAVPHDEKSSTLLQGRYLGDDELVQVVRPVFVMRQLLQTVVNIQRYVLLAGIVLGVATLATMVLVFMLSVQLRRRELETMIKIGGTRLRIYSLIATEIVGVLVAGTLLAGGLAFLTSWLGASATRLIIQLT